MAVLNRDADTVAYDQFGSGPIRISAGTEVVVASTSGPTATCTSGCGLTRMAFNLPLDALVYKADDPVLPPRRVKLSPEQMREFLKGNPPAPEEAEEPTPDPEAVKQMLRQQFPDAKPEEIDRMYKEMEEAAAHPGEMVHAVPPTPEELRAKPAAPEVPSVETRPEGELAEEVTEEDKPKKKEEDEEAEIAKETAPPTEREFPSEEGDIPETGEGSMGEPGLEGFQIIELKPAESQRDAAMALDIANMSPAEVNKALGVGHIPPDIPWRSQARYFPAYRLYPDSGPNQYRFVIAESTGSVAELERPGPIPHYLLVDFKNPTELPLRSKGWWTVGTLKEAVEKANTIMRMEQVSSEEGAEPRIYKGYFVTPDLNWGIPAMEYSIYDKTRRVVGTAKTYEEAKKLVDSWKK